MLREAIEATLHRKLQVRGLKRRMYKQFYLSVRQNFLALSPLSCAFALLVAIAVLQMDLQHFRRRVDAGAPEVRSGLQGRATHGAVDSFRAPCRETEVSHADQRGRMAAQQDVGGLDVPVHYTYRVQLRQRCDDNFIGEI